MEHIKAEIELFRRAAKELLGALPEDVVLMARLAEINVDAESNRLNCYLFFISTYTRTALSYKGRNYPYIVGIELCPFPNMYTGYMVRIADRWGYRETLTASPDYVADMIRQASHEMW